MNNGAILEARSLGVRAGERELVQALDFSVGAGEFVAMLGRNGSGKSLTLHTFAGLRAPAAGSVHLDGQPLASLPRRAAARRIGLLLQDIETSYPMSALESVLIGRHPHLSPWQWESEHDRVLARAMLARVRLDGFESRDTGTLSGGEQRRLAMASLLAQQPAVFLLDEPTNHLDPHHQLAMLDLYHEQTRAGHAVVAILHDPTIAARYADRAVLLFGDGRWLAGRADEVLTAENLSALYLTRIERGEVAGRTVFLTA